MNIRLRLVSMSMLVFLSAPVALAEPPAKLQIEVDFLLAYVDGSGCEFYRNGTWHNSKKAQMHLRNKYRYLLARNKIVTTEDFIEQAATKSSFSGRPYDVRCGYGTKVSSDQWLRVELARFRKF